MVLSAVVKWQWLQSLSCREGDLWPPDQMVDCSIQWAYVGFHVIESRYLRLFSLFHRQKRKKATDN